MNRPSMTYIGKAGGLKPIRSMVTISGDSEVIIENCRRILECNEIKCSVIAAGYAVDVWGSELSLTSFASGSVGVYGKVQSVSIERRSKGGAED